ncbi:site-specific integrase [Burkholderia stagnalis]|uniref:tyrosine-type recombinase/integrase n=1 Tax=Burkholderia stagnalis TaxID=1503054 RepID=UPI000F5C850A|nr:site-specific integrase [Burkholderia stagnalis]RQY67305.1 site-specific integrase [Burkholderia stagnalis]
MGSIQRRPSGKYSAKVRKSGFPAQSRTFLTRADAQRWIAETEAAMSRACFVDTATARSLLLSDALHRYEREVTPTKRSHESEAIRLRALARDSLASYSLANLTPAVLAQWRDRRLSTVSGSTVNRELNLLHHVLEVARKDWAVAMPTYPVADVRRPRSNPGRTRRLSIAEQSLLLYECKRARSWWLAPIVELALHTGMRQSEVRTLDWRSIDLERRIVILEAAATKTMTMRGVPLSSRCIAVLGSLPGDRSGPVFPGVTRNAAKLAFDRARKRAGLTDFRFHDLRHEATTRLFELGLSATEVQSVTGHRTTAMLARYTHLQAADLAKKLG